MVSRRLIDASISVFERGDRSATHAVGGAKLLGFGIIKRQLLRALDQRGSERTTPIAVTMIASVLPIHAYIVSPHDIPSFSRSRAFAGNHKEGAKPFVWAATARSILDKGEDTPRLGPQPSTKLGGDANLNESRRPHLGSRSTRFQLAQLGLRTPTTIDRRTPWRSVRRLKIELMTARSSRRKPVCGSYNAPLHHDPKMRRSLSRSGLRHVSKRSHHSVR